MIRLLALLLLLSSPAFASQNSIVLSTTSPYPGLTMLNNANSAFNTLMTLSSGGSAPATIYQYQLWYDTANNLLKWTPDGSTWQVIGKYSSSLWVPTSSGIPLTCPTATGSANAYAVTYAPAATTWAVGQRYCFLTNFSNTGAATVNINGVGARNLTKNGATALAGGDLGNGVEVDCIYDGTQCQLVSQLSSASSGTVTAVATGTGLTGGTITNSGTISLATVANKTILGNTSGSTAAPTPQTSPVVSGTMGAQGFTLTGTGSVPAGATGVYSTGAGTLNLSTTGTIAGTIGSDQGWTFGAPSGGDLGSGTVNMQGCFVNGSPCVTGSGNGLTLVAKVTASGSSSAVFDSSKITSTYPIYLVTFDSVYTTDAGPLNVVVSPNNGSSYISDYSSINAGGSAQLDTATITLASATGNTSAYASSGNMQFSNPSVNEFLTFEWHVFGLSGDNTFAAAVGGGYARNGAAQTTINNIKIFDSSGGNLNGTFRLYGLAN